MLHNNVAQFHVTVGPGAEKKHRRWMPWSLLLQAGEIILNSSKPWVCKLFDPKCIHVLGLLRRYAPVENKITNQSPQSLLMYQLMNKLITSDHQPTIHNVLYDIIYRHDITYVHAENPFKQWLLTSQSWTIIYQPCPNRFRSQNITKKTQHVVV